MNSVTLTGNLCRDPELNYTSNGTAVANTAIAVSRFRGSGDDREEITHFFEIRAWGNTGENLAKLCQKGTRLGIMGELELDRWEDKDGNPRSRVCINARVFEAFARLRPKDGEEEEEPEGVGAEI